MALHAGHPLATVPSAGVPVHRRLYGLGSVYGKAVRDARLGFLVVTATLGLIFLFGGAAMATEYGSLAARRELAAMTASLPPVMRAMYGNPVGVDTLGGFVTWHYAGYFSLIAGLWSILALSSTLAGEARRGSLDLVASAPLPRLRIALEKVAGHVTALVVSMTVVAIAAWAAGVLFATFPDDAIAPSAAAGFALGLGLRALIAGSVAFALAPFTGRAAAAGLAGTVLLLGYFATAYRAITPAFDWLARLSWFGWTENHLPLAGRSDPASLGAVAVVTVVLLGAGVVGFTRRDIGIVGTRRTPGLPRILVGVRGPLSRAFGEALPTSLSWGVGLGLFGLLMSAASRAFADEMRNVPTILEAFRAWLPGVDLTTQAGFLELLFMDFGLVLVGLAAATIVAGRMADETSGRFELLLTTPLARVRWAITNGIATWLGIAVVIALVAATLALGVSVAGGDVATPLAGTLVLGCYGAALAGLGFAAGGLFRASVAGPVVAAVALATFLVDELGPALALPGWLQDLALSNHLGDPMLGAWDPAGIAACVVFAAGGLLVGAWGLRRRDVEG